MRVYLVYSSSQVAARVIRELLTVPAVTFVGQRRAETVACAEIRDSRPDIVLFVGVHLDAVTLRRTLTSLKQMQPVPRVLIMTDYPYPQYRKECLRIGADLVFDTATEFTSMIALFQNERVLGDSTFHGGVS